METRFTVDKGFVKESRRGGGGYIKISKINLDNDEYVSNLILESVGDELSQKRLSQILEKLRNEKIISDKEKEIIFSALSDLSLAMPFTIKDNIRAKAFKNVLTTLMKQKEE